MAKQVEGVDNEFSNIPGLEYNKTGLKNSLKNLIAILTHHPEWKWRLGFNQITRNVHKFAVLPFERAEIGNWLETDVTAARLWVANEFLIEPTITDMIDAVRFIAHRHSFNPLKLYLDGLKWDGVQRIDSFCPVYLGSEDKRAYTIFITAFFISAVARGREPGCKVDTAPIFIGRQGARKSSFIRVLFGKEYFTDAPFKIPSQNMYMMIRGKWGVELPEFDRFTPTEVANFKAACAQWEDLTKDPYARALTCVPRSCIFIATTNFFGILTDPTGNRRFMPIKVGHTINVDAIERDRDQLWAEAAARHSSGEPWHFDENDPDVLAEVTSVAVADPWDDIISEWLNDRSEYSKLQGFHASEIYDLLGISASHVNKRESARLSAILNKHGYFKAPNDVSINGLRKAGYIAGATGQNTLL